MNNKAEETEIKRGRTCFRERSKAQRMLNDMRNLEEMRDEDIGANLGRVSRESVRKWRQGARIIREYGERIIALHAQVMFLRKRGIHFRDFGKDRFVTQVYEEQKTKETEAA